MELKFGYLIVAMAAIYAAAPSASHAQTKLSQQHEKCMDSVDLGALKNSQFAACDEQELKRQDVTLNAIYNKVRTSLAPEQKDALVKGQRSWLKFREDWCRFEEVRPNVLSGYASYQSCLLDVTVRQIDTIKNIQP